MMAMIKLVKKLFSIFHLVRPDIIHVQYLAPGLIPILTARLAGMSKILATVHIAGSIAYSRKAKFLLRFAALLCNRFICVSRGVEEFWFGSSQIFDLRNIDKSRKHFTVYNVIDTDVIYDIVQKVDKNKKKEDLGITHRIVIGIVGRVAHQKGHEFLLNAMAEIVKIFPDTLLLVIGDGPERKNLKAQSVALNLDNNVMWLDALPQEIVFELYAIMDIFVMPSLYEGFGLTAAEAMAAGVPVVGTRIEGLSEVIEDGVSGYLVPPGDAQALGEALLDLLKEPAKAKAFGRNGRMRSENLFSLEHFKKLMLAIYSSL